MAFKDLREYIAALEKRGELLRISTEVDPNLEITEICDRVVKRGGPALFFEKVKGSSFPLVTNLFGTKARMEFALGGKTLAELGARVADFLHPPTPGTLMEKIALLPKIKHLGDILPRMVKDGPCQEVIEHDCSLLSLPVLRCWPQDGGPFITLPLVFTKDPQSGRRNVGMYRMQVYDGRTTGMHWHLHKHGADHFRAYQARGERMPCAVALGGDPSTIFAAAAPLPKDVDEMLFAGFLRESAVELTKCVTCGLEVPAQAEIVLEGYLEPGETRPEGPFGDHTGYYSPIDEYPLFHLECLTRRGSPIYPTTVVGIPPMEDSYIGKAIEAIFLPLLRFTLPEAVDINFPLEGVFHNCLLVSIKKTYPGQGKKVIYSILGMGQMMLTKVIVVLDDDVDIRDYSQVAWRVLSHLDPRRDLVILDGPADALEHASSHPYYGSKLGIDATRKGKEEGMLRPWPEQIKMTERIRNLVESRWKEYGFVD